MFTKTKYLWILTTAAMLLLIAAQCGAQPPAEGKAAAEEERELDLNAAIELAPVPLGDGEKLKVVATTSIVADIVSQVGGDMINLILLLPVGSDPHSFEATPRDLANVAEAHVVFANGLGLEEFLDEILENAGGEATTVHVSQGLEARQMGEGEAHEHEDDHEEEHHPHPGADPHAWMTPANATVFVHNIEHTLRTLDPARAEAYEANAEAYRAELEELDTWVKAQIESIPVENRELVTDHTVFGYYADRYGLEQIGAVIPAFSSATEPSAQELAELENVIKQYNVKAIFVGNTVNSTLSQRVADDTGTQLVTVYTGSLGPEGSGVESYVDYIKHNTNAIVEGLK
jgi:manganese/iron transport system substrate-binding protein